MIPRKAKYLFLSIFYCLLALAPAIARADVEGIVRYGVTPADLQTDFAPLTRGGLDPRS
jgi:hypothetical protein